jgi:hypothetical protein
MNRDGTMNPMDGKSERERLEKWLSDIAGTEDAEVDCNTLDEMLERVVAIGSRGDDIRSVLPQVALHLEHCPDCSEWYDALIALARETE